MRRIAIAALLLVSCASGAPRQRMLSVEVLEPVSQRRVLIGPHAYTVRVQNVSSQVMQIESIRVDIAGAGDLQLDGGMESINETMASGETRDFPMYVTVSAMRGAQMPPDITSLRVMITGRTEAGTFLDDDVHYIRHEGLGG